MAEKSYVCYRIFTQPRFRVLQEFDDTDVPSNVTLLPEVVILLFS